MSMWSGWCVPLVSQCCSAELLLLRLFMQELLREIILQPNYTVIMEMRGSCLETQTQNDDETAMCPTWTWVCLCVCSCRACWQCQMNLYPRQANKTSDSRWSSCLASAVLVVSRLRHLSVALPTSAVLFVFSSFCTLFLICHPLTPQKVSYFGYTPLLPSPLIPNEILSQTDWEADERGSLAVTLNSLFTETSHKP